MGRYAFFNTNLEYKFWFGVQASQDIEKFGGFVNYISENDAEIEWTQLDLEDVLTTVRELESEYGFPSCDFDKYEKSLDGTHALRNDIHDSLTGFNENQVCLYLIGALIYHQLLYTEKLEASYEL